MIASSAPLAPQSSPAGPTVSSTPLSPDPRYGQAASPEALLRTSKALEEHGFQTRIVDSAAEAREAALALVPDGAEIFDASSRTLSAIGVTDELARSGRFTLLRPKVYALAKEGKPREQRKLGSSPDYVLGSVHAVTEDGQVVIASATGSQLAPYAFGAGKVVWVVGSQKIVKDLDDAFRRIREYSYPLEDARAREVYGQGSLIGKTLVVSREVQPGRISIILVRENLGF